MELLNSQKTITQRINEGQISNVAEFIEFSDLFGTISIPTAISTLETFTGLEVASEAPAELLYSFYLSHADSYNYLLLSTDIKLGTDELSNYHSLLRILEDNKLISSIKNEEPQIDIRFLWYYSKGEIQKLDKAMLFYMELAKITINKSPALDVFIKNDFRTFEEIKFEKEDWNRKAMFWIAMSTALISLIIGLITVNSSTRKATIINPMDTVKVQVLNPYLRIDTTHMLPKNN